MVMVLAGLAINMPGAGGVSVAGNTCAANSVGTFGADPNLLANDGGGTQLITEIGSYTSTAATFTAWNKGSDGCWRPATLAGQPAMPYRSEVGENGLVDHRQEKDGTTPTGLFDFTSTFYGISTVNPNPAYSYHNLVCGDWWDEDSGDPQYNQFVHVPCGTSPSFGPASEALWTFTQQYQHFAVINYNPPPTTDPIGSGIFMHDDTASGVTAGCIALPSAELDAVLAWMNPADNPHILIATTAEVAQLSTRPGRPAVATKANGAMELFAPTADGRLLTTWQPAAKQPFGGWLDMGVPAVVAGSPAAGAGGNEAEVFVRTEDDRLLTSWETDPSQPFGGWLDLGLDGQFASDPAVGVNADHGLEVYARSTDGRLLTSWQPGTNQPFGGWLALPVPNPLAGTPQVVVNSNGTQQIFVRTSDDRLLTSWQSGPDKPFGGWLDLGADGSIGGDPGVGINASGGAAIVVATTDHRLFEAVEPGPGQPFGPWSDMGIPDVAASTPALAVQANGALQVFVQTMSNRLLTAWEPNQGTVFGAFLDLGLDGQMASAPWVTSASGVMQVFVRSTGSDTLTTWQNQANQPFGGWLGLGMPG